MDNSLYKNCCVQISGIDLLITLDKELKQGKPMAKPKLKTLAINQEWCKGCSICVAFCPKNVWDLGQKDKATPARPDDCICCKMCELRCPDLAIEVVTETKKSTANRETKE